jgi:hypothetical protein
MSSCCSLLCLCNCPLHILRCIFRSIRNHLSRSYISNL